MDALDADVDEFERQAEELLDWSNHLDFESYQRNWQSMAMAVSATTTGGAESSGARVRPVSPHSFADGMATASRNINPRSQQLLQSWLGGPTADVIPIESEDVGAGPWNTEFADVSQWALKS